MANDIKEKDREYRPLVYVASRIPATRQRTQKRQSSTAVMRWSRVRSHWHRI